MDLVRAAGGPARGGYRAGQGRMDRRGAGRAVGEHGRSRAAGCLAGGRRRSVLIPGRYGSARGGGVPHHPVVGYGALGGAAEPQPGLELVDGRERYLRARQLLIPDLPGAVSVEDDGFIAVEQHPVFDVPTYGAGEDHALDITALAAQL